MAANKDFYWFGVKKLELALLPQSAGTAPTWVHVPSIEQAQLKASVSEVKVYGDDTQQYTFVHSPEMQLQVKLTKFSGKIAELLTGNTAFTASGNEGLYMMTNKDLNPPLLVGRVTLPAKDDATGQPKDLYLVFFKLSARPIWDNFGSERGKATELNWVFDALSSTKDERGDNLPAGIDYAFGKYLFPTS
jgi:hypothetical protein